MGDPKRIRREEETGDKKAVELTDDADAIVKATRNRHFEESTVLVSMVTETSTKE